MSLDLNWRFNEGALDTGSIGGTIDASAGAGVLVTTGQWTVFTSSSSDAVESRGYWWFDTRKLPAGAVVTSAQFVVRYASAIIDEFLSEIAYYLHNDAFLGSSLDLADYAASNMDGILLGHDHGPAAASFWDSGAVSDPRLASEITNAGFAIVVAKMGASFSTSSYVDYTTPTSWRTAGDLVPRLILQFSAPNSEIVAGSPLFAGVPARVGTPTRAGLPSRTVNP